MVLHRRHRHRPRGRTDPDRFRRAAGSGRRACPCRTRSAWHRARRR
jgi:hypothetical protein